MTDYRPGERFDTWVKLTEDNLSGEALGIMRGMQKKAKLFVFDDESFVSGADRLERIGDLMLPFETVAVELQSRVVCITSAEASSQWISQAMLHGPEGSNVVIGMFIDKLTYSFQVQSASYFKDGKFVGKFHDSKTPSIVEKVQRYADESVWMIKISLAILNCKDRFILEQTPTRLKPKDKVKRAAYSYERQTYTVIDPMTIRKRMHLCETGVRRRGHDVRGHWRTFRSDRYTEAKGKSIWINAYWAGPTENTVDGVKYRVRIDK